jgi:VWFA-related protein
MSCSALFSALILCFAAALSPAQTPTNHVGQAPAAPAPLIRTQTRLVVLDVLVTDSHGDPVKGLTVKDFELREDGAKRVLKTVEEHGIAAPASSDASAPAGLPAGPGVYSNKPPSGEVWNVLLLDLLNPTTELQASAGQQLEKFVKQLPPEQPVALVVMGDPSKLEVPFSGGAAGIEKFLATRKLPASSTQLDEDALALPSVFFIDMTQPNAPVTWSTGSKGSGGSGGAASMAQQMVAVAAPDMAAGPGASKLRNHMAQLINTFSSVAEWLSHYPGRKNVYWISKGFPHLDEDTPFDPRVPQPGRRASLFGKEQQRMDKLLQNARVAVFPIDLSGVRIKQPGLFEYARIDALQDFAEQTGGVLRENNNDIGMILHEEFNRSRDFYTLTYTPSGKNWNGQLRKISLAVKQRGYQLAYRQGYYATDVALKTPTLDDFNQALSHDAEQINDVVFSVHAKKDAGNVVLDYAIDPHSLQFDTAADGHHNANVECVVTEYDAEGKLLGTARAKGTANVTPEKWADVNQSGIPGHTVVPFEAKLAFLKVGIRDSATGRFGTLEMSLGAGVAPR